MLVVYCKIHCKILIYSRNCIWQATCSHVLVPGPTYCITVPLCPLFPFVRYSCSYLHAGPLFDTLTAATFESKGWSPVSKGKILRQSFFYFVDAVSLLFRIFSLCSFCDILSPFWLFPVIAGVVIGDKLSPEWLLVINYRQCHCYWL